MNDTPRRIQRQRTKGWKMPPNTIYVGRPTKYGNPYRVGDGLCETPTDAIAYYRLWLIEGTDYVNLNPSAPPDEEEIRRELHGKNLACWCSIDEPCHADVLLEIANQPTNQP